MDHHPVTARFFDGKSALAHDVTVSFGLESLSIRSMADLSASQQGNDWLWYYRDIILTHQDKDDIRLGNSAIDEATLVLPSSAKAVINRHMPELLSGKQERKRMAGLIIGLVSASAIIAAGIFIGVPMASGPLAKATPKDYEITMGRNLAAQINTFIRPCKNADEAKAIMQPALNEMAQAGSVGFPIEFQFVSMNAPNAFALPGGQVMATKGLLRAVDDDQEAFMAVMAHELGHVRSRDGMQAFYRNAGLGILLEVITGGSGLAQQGLQLSGQMNQMRHSRKQEARADDTAIEIMNSVGLNPEALARAFEDITKQSQHEKDTHDSDENNDTDTKSPSEKKSKRQIKIPGWLNSHPDTQARIDKARKAAAPSTIRYFTDEEWTTIQNACTSPSAE